MGVVGDFIISFLSIIGHNQSGWYGDWGMDSLAWDHGRLIILRDMLPKHGTYSSN